MSVQKYGWSQELEKFKQSSGSGSRSRFVQESVNHQRHTLSQLTRTAYVAPLKTIYDNDKGYFAFVYQNELN
jgi:hypothetical protein